MLQAFADYVDLMEMTEKFISGAANVVLGTTVIASDGVDSTEDVDLKAS